jgi:hypothetical protein
MVVRRAVAAILLAPRHAQDGSVGLAEFSGIDGVLHFHHRILIEAIPQHVEHALVSEAVVVVAQRAAKSSLLAVDADDDFDIDEVEGGPKPLPTS